MEVYERKYGVLSETFYESYMNGEEPEDDVWTSDWSDWAGAYKIWLRRQEQYRNTIQNLRAKSQSLINVIERIKKKKVILEVEIIDHNQANIDYSTLDQIVGLCETGISNASVNHDKIIYYSKKIQMMLK